MIDVHGRLIERLKAHDPVGAKAALQNELDEARTGIMEKIMQEEAASWHLGTGK